MRLSRAAFSFFLAVLFAQFAFAQQTSTSTTQSSPQALTLLQQSLAALTGSQSVTDVTLSGTVERIAGGADEIGSVTYKALLGSSRLDLSFPSGTWSEIRSTTVNGVTGRWIDPNSVSHPTAGHNVMTDVGWFPLFTVNGILSSTTSVVSYIGLETRGGSSVIHVTAWQRPAVAWSTTTALPQHLSQVDLYLDPSTLLPSIVAFSIHPDNNALTDIAIEIHFSDYRTVSGILVPFHVQKFLNNGLYVDLQFQNAVINSGLTASSFTN